MDNGRVTTEIKDSIAYITFFHPQSNSLPGNILRNLAKSIEDAGNNHEAKVIVMQSEGEKVFCSGASFDELASINDLDTGKIFFSGFAQVINAIRKCPKFVIGRVQGKAAGGGVGLAAAADYCLATVHSAVRLSELALGIGPFVVGPIVARKVGNAAYNAMAIDYEWYSAEWAHIKGLYVNIYETIDELDNAVNFIATKLVKTSPGAMSDLKKVIWQGTEDWDELLVSRAEISGRLVLSDFTKNFISEFKASKK